jgi:predicted RNase H-like HicB family nuclease
MTAAAVDAEEFPGSPVSAIMVAGDLMPAACAEEETDSSGRHGGKMRYTVIIEKGRESGFVAVCPVLPGCVSQGKTKRDTLKNIREAIEAYVEAFIEDGLPVPTETGRETVEIRIAAR